MGEPARFGDQEILLAVKSLGFRARAVGLTMKDLDNAILPALARPMPLTNWLICLSSLQLESLKI